MPRSISDPKSRCWAEISSSALVGNLNSLPAPVSHVMAVVKANAYGHGADIVIPILARAGVRHFGCATISEAIQARNLLRVESRQIDLESSVYMMPASPLEDADLLVSQRITPYCTDFELAKALSKAAQGMNSVAKLHVEVDSGIGRAGVAPRDLAQFVKAVRALPGVEISGICTHFTAADDESGADDAIGQHKLFTDALASLDSEWLSHITIHAANSPAALRLTGALHDLIRPGLLIYGIGPLASMTDGSEGDFPYRPVMTLKARVLLVRNLPAGSTISYNRTYTLPRAATIATIAVGYGDGFPRRLSNIGSVLLPGGLRAPIRGRICMDQLCVELPDGSQVKVGDEAVLIGKSGSESISALELADIIQTTPHEITTCLLNRIERVLA